MPDPNPNPNPNPEPNPNPAPAAPWYGADAPDDIKGFVQNKGWDSPLKAITSYRELEAFNGAPADRRIILPKDLSDPKALGEIFGKLGRPENAEGYGLKAPEGQDPGFLQAALPAMHALGLTRAQAEGLHKFMGEWQTKAQADLDAKAQAAVQQEETALKVEWGRDHDKNIAIGQRAAAALGLTQEEVDGVEAALGYGATMKLFQRIGAKLGEDVLNLGAPAGGKGAMTVEQAKARLEQLKGDSDWVQRWSNGGAAEVAEKNRLDAIIAGVPQAA